MSEISLNSTTREPFQFRDIPLKEMMTYYTPRWMAWVGFLCSIATAFNMPMFGFCLSRFVSVLALPVDTEADKDYFVD